VRREVILVLLSVALVAVIVAAVEQPQRQQQCHRDQDSRHLHNGADAHSTPVLCTPTVTTHCCDQHADACADQYTKPPIRAGRDNTPVRRHAHRQHTGTGRHTDAHKQFTAQLFMTEPNCGVTAIEELSMIRTAAQVGVVIWMSDASATTVMASPPH